MPTQLSHQPCTLLGFKCGFVGCTGTWSNSNSHKLSAGGMLITAYMASLAALKVLPIFCARSCKKETQATPTEQNKLDGTKWWKVMKNHEICFTKIWCFWQLLFASEARRISVDLLLSSITSSQLPMERLFSNPELVSRTQKLLATNTLTMFSTLIHHDHSHVLVHESIYPFHFNPCCSTSIPQEGPSTSDSAARLRCPKNLSNLRSLLVESWEIYAPVVKRCRSVKTSSSWRRMQQWISESRMAKHKALETSHDLK